MLKHCDGELLALLDSSVPPVDLFKIGSFKIAIARYQRQAADSMSVFVSVMHSCECAFNQFALVPTTMACR